MRDLVYIETPFRSEDGSRTQKYRYYLADCIRESIARGEAPFASHGFYANYLDDNVDEQREAGIDCGLAWAKHASKTIVYIDYGISSGMHIGIDRAKVEGRPVEYRRLGMSLLFNASGEPL